MIIPIDAKKAFDQIQCIYWISSFLRKTLNKLEMHRIFLNLLRTSIKFTQLTPYLTATDQAFPVNSGIRQGCSLLPLLLNTVLEVLARAIGKKWK